MPPTDIDFTLLYEWQSPGRMHRTTEALRGDLGKLILSRSGRDFREAFVASRFAEHLNADAVKLLRADNSVPTPDFAIKLGEAELWYETTEADRPGRKRGDETELEQGTVASIPEWERTTPEQYFHEVERRTTSKAQKNYPRCHGLIIYSNAFPIDCEEMMDINWWRDATRSAHNNFTETWVYKNSQFTRLS